MKYHLLIKQSLMAFSRYVQPSLQIVSMKIALFWHNVFFVLVKK